MPITVNGVKMVVGKKYGRYFSKNINHHWICHRFNWMERIHQPNEAVKLLHTREEKNARQVICLFFLIARVYQSLAVNQYQATIMMLKNKKKTSEQPIEQKKQGLNVTFAPEVFAWGQFCPESFKFGPILPLR